jgi:hypothetical protein
MLALALVAGWDDLVEKRVVVVAPGRLVRGAWQRPWPLRRLIEREKIRTVVTLTAINRDDPKFLGQERVIREAGVDWIIVPMRGSRATLDQMAEAADLLADPRRQPVFFHCVAGHHRTSLVHAAFRMRHEGWTAERAWREVAQLPWARPETDLGDRLLIEAFAAVSQGGRDTAEGTHEANIRVMEGGPPRPADGNAPAARVSRLEAGDGQLRDRRERSHLSVGPDEAGHHPQGHS